MNIPKFVTPNLITLLRVAFVPVGAFTLFKNGGEDPMWQYISWTIFFILGLSDILDGKLARSRGAVTELGKFLDPVADKFMLGTAMISLSILERMPWWITAVILTHSTSISTCGRSEQWIALRILSYPYLPRIVSGRNS
jgi:CDP-diacylglycerol--glycerol-3-phosphate 3-phosphatidyltransferase